MPRSFGALFLPIPSIALAVICFIRMRGVLQERPQTVVHSTTDCTVALASIIEGLPSTCLIQARLVAVSRARPLLR